MKITIRPVTKLTQIIIHRKVAAYCRVSTQQEIQHHSLEAQLEKVDVQKATIKQQRNILCSSASLMLCQFPSLRAAPFSTPPLKPAS